MLLFMIGVTVAGSACTGVVRVQGTR